MIHDSVEQTEQRDGNLKLGCYGWLHTCWQGAYYPDDLPADWRLSYYANDFSCVLVPADYWQQHMDVEDWLDEVHESFRFYMEWPREARLRDNMLQACGRLGNQLGGVLLNEEEEKGVDLSLPIIAPGEIWRPGREAAAGVGVMDSIQGIDLQQQRNWLEAFDRASHHQALALFVMDVNVDHKQLDDMQKLAEMLGL